MWSKTISLGEIQDLAQALLDKHADQSIWLFDGNLGAGKTTLIKAICKQLGVSEMVNSPTFSLINEYVAQEQFIYHFDLYRLQSEEEGWDIGMEEYLESGKLCLIEWPEKMAPVYDWPHLRIKIVVNEEETRTINITEHD
jgi:tRNA threonylcarbamoyladenosine biosynthesis protein TsaE